MLIAYLLQSENLDFGFRATSKKNHNYNKDVVAHHGPYKNMRNGKWEFPVVMELDNVEPVSDRLKLTRYEIWLRKKGQRKWGFGYSTKDIGEILSFIDEYGLVLDKPEVLGEFIRQEKENIILEGNGVSDNLRHTEGSNYSKRESQPIVERN